MSSQSGPHIDPSPAEKFFGLSARPFSLTPDLRFAYHSRSHTHALEQVTSALRRREGLIVVTGAIGTGKTMLCRSMLETFEARTFLSVILDPGLQVEDLLRKVLTDFGIMGEVGDAPAAGPISDVTRHQFVTTLQQFLATLIPLQAHAVIMIDEAQHLSPRVLEEIRLLSNFETDEAKLLQIVLVGQPDLDDLLRRPGMQQLNQRVARRCELQPLSEAEVGDYIDRRLTVASSPAALAGDRNATLVDTPELVRFSPAAVKAVAGISEGIPRVINTLCDRTLEVAYERQIRHIDPDAVLAAAERLRLEVPGGLGVAGQRRWPRLAAAAAAIAVLAGGAWWWTTRQETRTPPATAAAPIARTPETPPISAPPASASPDAAPSSSVSTGTLASTPSGPGVGSIDPASASPSGASPAAAPVGSAATTAQPPQRPASAAPPAAAGSFQLAVAAFKTQSRADEVTRALAALDVPASVRLDPTGTWYRVVAGPFATREAAVSAQDALARQGYAGTRISPVASDNR